MNLKVIVSGAGGKMGKEVLKAVHFAEDMDLVGAVDPAHVGEDIGDLAGIGPIGVTVVSSVEKAIQQAGSAGYIVDFTAPHVVYDNVLTALAGGLKVVFGTTGLTDSQLAHIDEQARQKNLGVIHAPNFSMGAVLMMRFAKEAAQYVKAAEIIELHHDEKKDAPSGTAVKTAEMMREARKEQFSRPADDNLQQLEGARGALVHDIPIHSVRLPGLVAHQEVILGLAGETLRIRHDSMDRASFMPGVLLALRKVDEVEGLLYGLEHLL